MENRINVVNTLTESNECPKMPQRFSFIKQQGPDKQAAIKRRAATEEMLSTWDCRINDTNTREMPLSLFELYEEAYTTINEILEFELQLILGGE